MQGQWFARMRLTIRGRIRIALSAGTVACTGLVAIAGAGQTLMLGYPTTHQTTNEAIIVPIVPILNVEQPTRIGQPMVPSLPMETVSQVNNGDLVLPSSTVAPPNASDWFVPAPLPVPSVSPIAVPAVLPDPAIPDPAREANSQQAPAGGVYVCPPVAVPASHGMRSPPRPFKRLFRPLKLTLLQPQPMPRRPSPSVSGKF